MQRLVNYIKATKFELSHVKWPTRRQVIVFSLLVVGVSIFAALFLGLFDYIFSEIVDRYFIRSF